MRDHVSENELSPTIRRFLRRYCNPTLQTILVKHCQKHQEQTGSPLVDITELQACIRAALDELSVKLRAAEAKPLPDLDTATVTAAMADFEAGRSRRIEDVIDAFRRRGS